MEANKKIVDTSNLNPKSKTVSELVHGNHYFCMLSTRRVIYVERKIFGFVVCRRISWYDEEARKYRLSRVEDNQLRSFASTERI